MIQNASANWNPSVEGYARADSHASFERNMTAMENSIAVSASQPLALVEQQGLNETVAQSTKSSTTDSMQLQGFYSADTAVMALGLIGAWMMIIGGAMLSRRIRFFKNEDTAASAIQH